MIILSSAIQRVLNRLEKWSGRNLMKGNAKSCSWGVITQQLCRRGAGASGGHQVEKEPAIVPLLQRSPRVSWALLPGVLPAG